MENSSQFDRDYAYRWLALISLGLAIAIVNIDLTIVNVALPVIGRAFHSSLSELQWINNAYVLGMTCTVILFGRLADQYGHKKIFLIGVAIFFIGSLLCGIAPNITFLISARVLQGFGLAATFTMIFILAVRSFPEDQHAFAIGFVVIFTGLSQALGPTIGGVILQFASWRWIFFLNLPICIATIALAWFACAKDQHFEKQYIHISSVILLAIGLCGLLIALNESQNWGLNSAAFLLCFFLSLAILCLLIIWQLKLPHPFIELPLFKIKRYMALNFIRPIFQFTFGIYLFLIPIYLQNIRGISPLHTGFLLLIMTGVIGACAPISGRITDKIGIKYPLLVSQSAGMVGYIALILSLQWQAFWLMVISFILVGANTGMTYSATNFGVVSSLPATKKGIGTGMYVTIGFYAFSFGIAIVGLLLNIIAPYVFLHHIQGIEHINHIPHFLKYYITGAHPLSKLQHMNLAHADAVITAVKQAFTVGYQVILGICALVALVSLYFIRYL